MAANKRLSPRVRLPLIALFILTNVLAACDSGELWAVKLFPIA